MTLSDFIRPDRNRRECDFHPDREGGTGQGLHPQLYSFGT